MTDENLEIEQKKYLTANHKNEDTTFRNMTVNQKINYLQTLQKTKGLTNEQEDQLDKLREEAGIPVSNNKGLRKEKPKEREDPKDIFKEDDILHYMYNEWLLAGANWLWKKCYKGVAYIADKTNIALCDMASAAGKAAKEEMEGAYKGTPKKQDNMTAYRDSLQGNLEQTTEGFASQAGASYASLCEKIDRYATQTGTDEEKQDVLYKIVQEMSPRERTKFAQEMTTMARNATNNMIHINILASKLAGAQMLQEAMNAENPSNTSSKAKLEAQTRINSLLIARAMSAEENPSEFLAKLEQRIEKASQKTNSRIDKGKYRSNGKKVKKNSALIKANNMLGLDENAKPIQNIREDEHPQTLEEWFVTARNDQIQNHQRQEAMEAYAATEDSRLSDYDRRRLHFTRRVQNFPKINPDTLLHVGHLLPQGTSNKNPLQSPNRQSRGM